MGIRLKQRWAAGQTVLNGWLAIPHGFAAEVMAAAPWDSLTVDMQHGAQDYMSLLHCLQAVQPRGIPVMARVPSNEMGIINKALDAGAAGIICPLVNSEAEASSLARACRFPPAGGRSYGPIRAGLYADTSRPYPAQADESVVVLPMIETRAGLEALEAILAVPGVDGVYVGPNDLGLALGLGPMMDRDHPEVREVYRRIVGAASACGKVAGLHTNSVDGARLALACGFRLVTCGTDSGLIAAGARRILSALRG
jgi:4-hydroxy-2-oxoheptanedioate aldolase